MRYACAQPEAGREAFIDRCCACYRPNQRCLRRVEKTKL